MLPGSILNNFYLHYAIIGLEKTNNLVIFEWPFKTVFYCIQLSKMGIQFEKLKKIDGPTHTGKTGSGKKKQKHF